ncbi:hypothetical protein L6452_02201 [Arctium lappa]|uniref:Uncharacterized protein n=1 Tax=Arctium lappa TaxID=4217 RepID=A0ACB9FIW5_ARCLA|nr:hypothetical protein L6452_02201 [Arctium lappa]
MMDLINQWLVPRVPATTDTAKILAYYEKKTSNLTKEETKTVRLLSMAIPNDIFQELDSCVTDSDEDINAFAKSLALITHQLNKKFGKKVFEGRRDDEERRGNPERRFQKVEYQQEPKSTLHSDKKGVHFNNQELSHVNLIDGDQTDGSSEECSEKR